MPSEDVSLIVAGRAWSGWLDVRITRGCERVPADFDIAVTERFPGQPGQLWVKPGDACQIKAGADLLLTGYVDRYMPSISPDRHAVRVQGRSKCEDLVDCSAEISTYQINNTTPLALAQRLAAPFGISVQTLSGSGPMIGQFAVVLTETPMEIIERVTRWAALLAYDGVDGNLILSQIGTGRMVSGFETGSNIQAAEGALSVDRRFSKYEAVVQSVDVYSDVASAGGMPSSNMVPNGVAYDPGVSRYRPLLFVSEQGMNGLAVAAQRARWEMARRWGRSQAVRLTCDSWRDSAGALWAPNAKTRVHIPEFGLIDKTWVISEVTYIVSRERGTVAELLLMPPQAFEPNPILLYPFDWQVYEALHPGQVVPTLPQVRAP